MGWIGDAFFGALPVRNWRAQDPAPKGPERTNAIRPDERAFFVWCKVCGPDGMDFRRIAEKGGVWGKFVKHRGVGW